MSHYKILACAFLVAAVVSANATFAEAITDVPLSMDEAVAIAVEASDPTVTRFDARAAAHEDRAVSDSQLPDPQVRVGMMNWPVDSFRYGQEAMTKLEVGVQQAIPKGSTLRHQSKKRSAEAERERTAKSVRVLEIERDVRRAWLDLYYWANARGVVLESRDAVSDLVNVVRSFYATGRQSGQDVLRAELELSLLDDRLVDVDRQIEKSRADLARYIGPGHGARSPAAVAPILATPLPLEQMIAGLAAHPAVRVQDADVRVLDEDIALAKQQYKPGWSVEAAYGSRGGSRADLATLMVRFDVPLFTKNRQDRRLSAARRDRQSAQLDRQGRLLEFRQKLERAHADWLRFGERIKLFEETVLVRASGNADAALDGYRNKTSDFAELIRSRLSELNLELAFLKLRADQAKAGAELIYLRGDM